MTLSELKKEVDSAIESAHEFVVNPDEIIVSLQINDSNGDAVWSNDYVELHYDNDTQTSGCVLTADLD